MATTSSGSEFPRIGSELEYDRFTDLEVSSPYENSQL